MKTWSSPSDSLMVGTHYMTFQSLQFAAFNTVFFLCCNWEPLFALYMTDCYDMQNTEFSSTKKACPQEFSSPSLCALICSETIKNKWKLICMCYNFSPWLPLTLFVGGGSLFSGHSTFKTTFELAERFRTLDILPAL